MLETTGLKKEDSYVERDNSLILIPGGKFLMGSDKFYPEEKPVHEVTVLRSSMLAKTG